MTFSLLLNMDIDIVSFSGKSGYFPSLCKRLPEGNSFSGIMFVQSFYGVLVSNFAPGNYLAQFHWDCMFPYFGGLYSLLYVDIYVLHAVERIMIANLLCQ